MSESAIGRQLTIHKELSFQLKQPMKNSTYRHTDITLPLAQVTHLLVTTYVLASILYTIPVYRPHTCTCSHVRCRQTGSHVTLYYWTSWRVRKALPLSAVCYEGLRKALFIGEFLQEIYRTDREG